MYDRFLGRGYNNELVRDCLDWVCNILRSELMNHIAKSNGFNTLVSNFGHISNSLKNILQHHYYVTQMWGKSSKICYVLCYKRASHLRDCLEYSYSPTPVCHLPLRVLEGTFKCFNCVVCNNMLNEKCFIYPLTNKLFKVGGIVICLSTFYVI